MTSQRPSDPFDLFRAAMPIEAGDPAELSPADAQLLARILATPVEQQLDASSPSRPQRRSSPVKAICAGASDCRRSKRASVTSRWRSSRCRNR